VVATLSSLVVGLVWLFEFLALRSQPETFVALQGSMALITKLFAAYALFAFVVSLIREVVKDAEDIQGDAQAGCMTFSVVHGTAASRILAMYLTIVNFILIGVAIWWLFNSGFIWVGFYLIVTVLLPLVFLLLRINASNSKSDFSNLSFLFKLLMLAGIFSMVPLAFLL
jgi:4-hydroxybenzoate polyprenyltransferase